jgi:hypothetical protein
MEFSEKSRNLQQQLTAFMQTHVYPNEAASSPSTITTTTMTATSVRRGFIIGAGC